MVSVLAKPSTVNPANGSSPAKLRLPVNIPPKAAPLKLPATLASAGVTFRKPLTPPVMESTPFMMKGCLESSSRFRPGMAFLRFSETMNWIFPVSPILRSALIIQMGIRESSMEFWAISRKSVGLMMSSSLMPSAVPQTTCCLPRRRFQSDTETSAYSSRSQSFCV